MRTAPLLLLLACAPRPLDLSAAPVVDDFALLDHEGALLRLSRATDAEWLVLVTYGVGCPIARQQLPALHALAAAWGPSVRVALLDANPQDDRAALAAEARDYEITLPLLHDDRQLVAEALGVTRTAEALVVRTRDRRLAWRGPVDDSADYGVQRAEASHTWLADAVAALRAGSTPPVVDAPVRGCLVSLPRSRAARADRDEGPPVYTTDVAPLLQARCQPCHRDGGIGPWAMTSYEVVRGWAPMMREVIRTRRMPPWQADPAIGTFLHDLSLPPNDAATVVHWAEEGTPRGDGPDPLTTPLPERPEWPLGPPDVIVPLPPQRIPARGSLPYRHFAVDVPLDHPVWVRAAHVLPGNARVLHHGTVFHVDAETRRTHRRGQDVPIWQENLLSTFVPGMWDGDVFPEESGRLLEPGDELRFTMHYVTTGKRESDATRLGLYFADAAPPHGYRVQAITDKHVDLPPGEVVTHEVVWTPDQAIRVYKVFPHMHLRGRAFTLDVLRPGAAPERVVSVPDYDFGWQRWYELTTPLDLPAGTRLRVRGTFDNTANNPFNPDPAAHVTWGEQTEDEMLIGYVAWRALAPTP